MRVSFLRHEADPTCRSAFSWGSLYLVVGELPGASPFRNTRSSGLVCRGGALDFPQRGEWRAIQRYSLSSAHSSPPLQYGFNAGEVGLVFYSVVSVAWFPLRSAEDIADPTLSRRVASIIGFGTNFYQERLYRAHVARRGPEARLYASLVGGLVFPAGAFILAFSQGRGHWMGPVVGLTLIFTGTYTIYLCVFSVLSDYYSIVRSQSLLGFVWFGPLILRPRSTHRAPCPASLSAVT